ncbi:MAG: hypothetical protein JKX73_08210 [Flavobacteriales bacterium]|nr:hypothetical protein [Flavobacteriales bacterium]
MMRYVYTIILFIGLGVFSFNSAIAQRKNYNSSKSNTYKIKEKDMCKKACCKKTKIGTSKNCKESCCGKKSPKGKGKKEKKTKVIR